MLYFYVFGFILFHDYISMTGCIFLFGNKQKKILAECKSNIFDRIRWITLKVKATLWSFLLIYILVEKISTKIRHDKWCISYLYIAEDAHIFQNIHYYFQLIHNIIIAMNSENNSHSLFQDTAFYCKCI